MTMNETTPPVVVWVLGLSLSFVVGWIFAWVVSSWGYRRVLLGKMRPDTLFNPGNGLFLLLINSVLVGALLWRLGYRPGEQIQGVDPQHQAAIAVCGLIVMFVGMGAFPRERTMKRLEREAAATQEPSR